MKALIIEDELASARRLERMLFAFEIEILDILTSNKQAVKWFENHKQPELIFLDIQLSDGLCFEFLKEVHITSKIIFTTAYSNYSLKAFDYNSISYLLKPIDKKALEKAILKAQKFINNEHQLIQLQKMVSSFETQIYKTSFAVKVGKKIKIIDVDEICCFYSSQNATYLKTAEHQYVINQSLTSLESQLQPELFFRVNRTFIVHINAIEDIIAYSNSRLKLILHSCKETEIVVSRERVKDFKAFIE